MWANTAKFWLSGLKGRLPGQIEIMSRIRNQVAPTAISAAGRSTHLLIRFSALYRLIELLLGQIEIMSQIRNHVAQQFQRQVGPILWQFAF